MLKTRFFAFVLLGLIGIAALLVGSVPSDARIHAQIPPLDLTSTQIVESVHATETAFAPQITPILSVPEATVEAAPPNDCISIVGDSIPYGLAVFEVPGHGFPAIHTESIASVMARYLAARYLAALPNPPALTVYDRSESASYLAPAALQIDQSQYIDSPSYAALLADRCRWTVIMPWYNDLLLMEREGIPDAAEDHVAQMAAFIKTLLADNPDGQILVQLYYQGWPAPFTIGADVALQPDNITRFNDALIAACADGGRFSIFPALTCMDTGAVFAEVADYAHLITRYGRDSFYALDIVSMTPSESAMFQVYFRDNPTGIIRGDGIHLSPYGKQLMVEAIWQTILAVDPNLAPTLP